VFELNDNIYVVVILEFIVLYLVKIQSIKGS
jgi:hypothetical protein